VTEASMSRQFLRANFQAIFSLLAFDMAHFDR
jgi:hypothetical protein